MVIYPPLGMFDTTGTYTITASHEELEETATIQVTVVEKADASNTGLENIKTKTYVANEPSNVFSEKTMQNDIEASNNEISSNANGLEFVQKSDTGKANVVTQKSSMEKTTESTNMPNQQEIPNAESPVIITAIGLSILGVVSGVVIWARVTYTKPAIMK